MSKSKVLLGITVTLCLLGSGFYWSVISKPSKSFNKESIFHNDNFSKLRFAHRGGYEYGPENTIETIVNNIRTKNINAIEVDVQITKDGELILFHDEETERLLSSSENKKITDYLSEELSSISLKDTGKGKVYVPSLSTTIDTLKSLILNENKKFLIELDFKPHGENTERAVSELLRIIEQQERELGNIIYEYFFVSTFYPEVISEIRKKSDKIIIALGVHSDSPSSKWGARAVIAASNFLVKKHGVNIIEPNHCMLTPKFVEKWTERGIVINTYTVNTFCEKEYVQNFDVAFTTNCPGKVCEQDESEKLTGKRNWCKNCSE